ncbi:MAG: Sec-independent protein translocase protein TatB [Thiobacillus sp.]
MFDIGFSELIMIGIVALIVIGPERLPKVARTAGHLYGRMQRYVSTVKSDISREMDLDELRRTGQEFKDSIESTVSEVRQQTTVVDDYLRDETASISKELSAISETGGGASSTDSEKLHNQPEQKQQHSLPLDEPDQNADATPSTVVETAHRDSTGKSA